ncbi:hypothetical protein FPC840_890046 [Flavobacterium psychrophilum]|nr:hypothetical protein FPC840_890046 [Flavobacterium psychrophilum]
MVFCQSIVKRNMRKVLISEKFNLNLQFNTLDIMTLNFKLN